MVKKTIAIAAVTGARPKEKNNPNVPLTPSEIVGDVHEYWKAEAVVAHLYTRDDVGNGTMDKEKFGGIPKLLKPRHSGCNITLNLTISGDLTATDETRQAYLEGLRPEMASYGCGSMNWLNPSLFINSPKFLKELGNNMQEWNIRPEIEVSDPGMTANAAYYLEKDVLGAPLHFQFCMGCTNGIPSTMKNLAFIKETMESLYPNSAWNCFGVGHCVMEVLCGTIVMGGHVRVEMEDNVLYKKGQLAGNNTEFVDGVIRVIRGFDSRPVTPDEARQLLGLTKG